MKYKLFTPIVFLFLVSSCVTLKWKRNYLNKKMSAISKTYGVDTNFVTTFQENLVGTSVRLMTKKQLKRNVSTFEKAFALHPDSTYTTDKGVDSFYFNKNKVNYIKEHKLQTRNIYFLSKS